MNNNSCPVCLEPFNFQNPPKKLKNCDHNLCDTCLPNAIKCPIDQKKIQYRKYTAKAFEINHNLLDQIQKKHQSPRKFKASIARQSTPKKQFQVCLLHSKPADIICIMDGSLICASCALFGEHRGHPIKNCDEVLNQLTMYTEQALQVFDKLKQKQENLNEEIVISYIDDCFVQQKNQEIKNVRQGFAKLVEKIKKAEKAAIAKIDTQIKSRKQSLLKEVSIHELQSKKNQWYKEVETLGNITQGAYQFRNIQQALRYLDQKSSESFLLKRGQYLQLQYSSSQNVIKNKIDTQTAKMVAVFSQNIDKAIDQYCSFAGGPEKKQSTPCSRLKQSNISGTDKKTEDDILIQQLPSHSQLSDSGFKKQIYLKPQIQNKSGYLIGVKIPQVTIAQSQHVDQNNEKDLTKQKSQRSKSSRQKLITEFNSVNRQVLGQVQNKKRRKIDIPQKYRQVFQDLKNDRCEVIDFGGAELGDQNVLGLCQYIEKTNKLRNLKLVRNKISDEVIKQLLNSCYCAKVTNLNLGQNSLTQKSLQMFEAFDLGELRNITLSLNKINRRNVKARIDQLSKRGITLSI